MKKINKKGFTMIELVIVIAVVAVLAGVLIPTFSTLVHKANVSADTQLAKNLNTALATYEAINGELEDFSEVLAAAREAGYIISQLNPTAEGCYFVWESDTNQILLVDSKDDYSVIYSIEEPKEIGPTWHFATSDKKAAAALREDSTINGANVQDMVASVDDFMAALKEGGTQTLYIDESVVLDKDNLLTVDSGANITINMGNSSLATDGVIQNTVPISVQSGTLTLNGGVVSAVGSGYDTDGDAVTNPLKTASGTIIDINGTKFDMVTSSSYIQIDGTANITGAVINSAQGLGLYAANGGKINLYDTTITAAGRCLWSTGTQNSASNIVVHSGTYHSMNKPDTGSGVLPAVSVCRGDIVIKGGTFTSDAASDGVAYMFGYAVSTDRVGTITIEGGTFNGKTAEQWGIDGLKKMCKVNGDGWHSEITENNGVYTITFVKNN